MGFVNAKSELDPYHTALVVLGTLAVVATAAAVIVHYAHTQPKVAGIAEEDHSERVQAVLSRAQSARSLSARLLESVS